MNTGWSLVLFWHLKPEIVIVSFTSIFCITFKKNAKDNNTQKTKITSEKNKNTTSKNSNEFHVYTLKIILYYRDRDIEYMMNSQCLVIIYNDAVHKSWS